MSIAKFDVLTIGNAIVDIISNTTDDFLVEEKIIKGAMNLIDAQRASHLYSVMGPAIETSGGSAGNTAVGVASLGGNSAYIGKVCNDPLGEIFTHDIRAIGVSYDTLPLEKKPPTARSFIFVTPDGERSMNTYLGACMELGPPDVEEKKIANSKITYFEGYLWDPPRAKEAIRQAAQIAHANGRQTAIALSDPFCVDRFRDEFLELMRSGTVDIIFANEAEILSLYQTSSFQSAIDAAQNDCTLSVITRGENGSLARSHGNTVEIGAHPIDQLVDSTGAGDLYAAGFLYGLTNNYELVDCARMGGIAAAEVIQHIGPRPQKSLADLMRQEGY